MGLLYFVGCFGPIITIWTNKMVYDSRFQSPDDSLHTGLEIFQLCMLATAVLHIRPVSYMSQGSNNPEMFFFCLAIWISFLYTIMTYVEIRFWGVIGQAAAKYAAVTSILWNVPSFLCITIATLYSGIVYFTPDDANDANANSYSRLLAATDGNYSSDSAAVHHLPIILLVCAWLSGIITQPIIILLRVVEGKGFKDLSVPLNIGYVIHRNGEWTMLMLGESILSLLIVEVSDEVTDFYITFYTGILSVILLQYLYFKSQPHDPDRHAMRRSRLAGLSFSFLIHIYSAGLIIVGVSFKMLLTEYSKDYSTYDGSSVSKTVNRFLAGDSETPKYGKEESRQRIAYFFLIGLAIVFLCLDLINLTHGSMERCHSSHGRIRLKGILLVVALRVGVIIFIGTACLYVTEPVVVALVGLACIFIQILIRAMGTIFFPSQTVHDHNGNVQPGQPNVVDKECNEEHWPNTTQPMAIVQYDLESGSTLTKEV